MKSVVCHSAKDLRIENTELPALGEHQLRVNVAYGGICGSDLHYYQHGGFGTVRIKQPIALGHKIARRALHAGDKVLRYGAVIGSVTRDVAAGEHLHTHNLRSDYLPTHVPDGTLQERP